ncbi:MAG: hypothetical protein P1V20_01980 [Verrucomicrobiales bacterium]|nr:hypothetical protein [Verrucomicrobiales bacterium]
MRSLQFVTLWVSVFFLSNSSQLFAEEVQAHGVSFEKWIRDTFFDGYEGTYTQKWDVSAEANQSELSPEKGIPISIKMVKYGSPIGLGDILRQRSLDHEFLMIVGFWQQKSATEKWIVEVECLHIQPSAWNDLWGGLSADKLEILDELVKDMDVDYKTVRTQAQDWKKKVLPELNCKIVVNPKIGSTSQRRVQCSMPFKVFWALAGREPEPGDKAELFGKRFPNPIYSKPRTFNK